jgi:hypothetical protein
VDRFEDRRAALLEQGLIASDAAYPIWLAQQQGVHWPWSDCETPEKAAYYRTRELWFWSRQGAALRAEPGWTTPQVPRAWRACATPLATGAVGRLDLRRGLLSLAQLLSAGHVTPPWTLGLTPTSPTRSPTLVASTTAARLAQSATRRSDMGYIDAFQKWGMEVFDDREHLKRYLDATRAPEAWAGWVVQFIGVYAFVILARPGVEVRPSEHPGREPSI